MRIEELSIGDWVMWKVYNKTYDIQITEIGNTLIKGLNDDIEYGVLLHQLSPIPLTAEILEKNGLEFIDDGNDAIIFLCCDMFWARLCVGDTYWQVGIHNQDRNDAVMCEAQNVHQLQHALRLAGIEKGIVL